MSIEDSESRRFEFSFVIVLSVPQADLAPQHSADFLTYYFRLVFHKKKSMNARAHGERYWHITGGIFELLSFLW